MSAKQTSLYSQGRHDRLIQERIHDPYKSHHKHPEPTVCTECKAVYSDGHWQWLPEIKTSANETLCPACRRKQEKVPAGVLTMSGSYFTEHKDELMNLLHNKVQAQNNQHPLKRVMDIEELEDGSTVVLFTDTHLPRDVGEALFHAYKGDLAIHYAEDEDFTRVNWNR